MELKLCTFNIRFILDRWKHREHLLLDALQTTRADLYSLQEVNIGGKHNGQMPKSIMPNLKHGSFTHFDSPGARSYITTIPILGPLLFENFVAHYFYDLCAWFNTEHLEKILGNFIQFIYRNPLLRILTFVGLGTAWVFGTSIAINTDKVKCTKQTLLQIGGWRCAQILLLNIANKRIILVNVHLSEQPEHDHVRRQEIIYILSHLKALESVDGVIINGDFNCTPNSGVYCLMLENGFRSVHGEIHNDTEPSKTFHNGLIGAYHHGASIMTAESEKTLDYVFIKGEIDIVTSKSVDILGTQPAAADSTLYASDHFGLACTLKF